MWILAVQGRQHWLLPGRCYTIGRTTKNRDEAVDIVVQESSVSRKHLALEVVQPTADAISHPSVRSDLYVTDAGSRFGTVLDGQRLAAHERAATPFKASDTVPLRIGSAITATLKWTPFVVTYATGQTGAAHDTLWKHALRLLKPLDVKLLPYLVKNTSVLVKAGATTSTVYFALAAGIPVANSHFLQALHDAATAASANGTAGDVTPDVAPFNPDPAWAPDPQRRSCLAGQTFHVLGEHHAAALRPIIDAAGGSYTDTPTQDTLWVLQNGADTPHIPLGSPFVDITAVFAAISGCRTIDPEEIRRAVAPHRALEAHKDGAAPPNYESRRPRHAKVNFFGALTSSQPSSVVSQKQETSKTVPPPKAGSNEGSTRDVPPQIGLDWSGTMVPTSASVPPTAKRRAEPIDAPLQKRARKIKATSRKPAPLPQPSPRSSSLTPPPPSPPRLPPNTGDNEGSVDEAPAVVDYSAIGELSVVDASMETTRPAAVRREPPADWSQRPNFKGFRRSQRVASTPRAAYDQDISENVPEDDDFDASASAQSASPSLREALRNPARYNGAEDSEESLFVASNPEDEFDARPANTSTGSLTRELSRAPVDVDDGFGFRFS